MLTTHPPLLDEQTLLPPMALIEDRLTQDQRERKLLRGLQRLAALVADYRSDGSPPFDRVVTK